MNDHPKFILKCSCHSDLPKVARERSLSSVGGEWAKLSQRRACYVNRPCALIHSGPSSSYRRMTQHKSLQADAGSQLPNSETQTSSIYKVPGSCYSVLAARRDLDSDHHLCGQETFSTSGNALPPRPAASAPVSSWMRDDMASHQEKGFWAGMAELWEIHQYCLDYS